MPIVTAVPSAALPQVTSPEVKSPLQVETHQEVQEKVHSDSPSQSSQFAALARREKMLRQKAREIESQKQAFRSKEAEIEQAVNSRWKEKLSQNTWDTLIEAGLSPDQVTQIMLNQPKSEDIQYKNLERELKELKESQSKSLEKLNQQQNEQYQQAKKQMSYEVNLLTKSDPSFEAVKFYGRKAEDEVVNLIEEVFNQGIPGVYQPGYIMPVEEATREVENYLVNEYIEAFKKIPKLKEKLSAFFESPQKQPILQKQPTPTLSNQSTPSTRPLTEKERKQRAILAFQGKL